MKILYLSSPYYFDMDLCYIHQLNKINDHIFLIDVPSYASEATAFKVKLKSKAGIYSASDYQELRQFSKFIDLDKTFIINRTSKKTYALSNIWLQVKINQFINKQNPDLVHANGLLKPYFYWFLKRNKIPRILTIHDPFPHSGEAGKKVDFIRKLNFLHFSHFILLNGNQKQEFSEKENIPIKNILTSRLGAYTFLSHYLKPSKKEPEINSPKVLFFGRISPYKGIKELCEAMLKVIEVFPEAELIIAGAGDFDFDISPYQKSPNFTFLNRYISTEELVELLQSAQFVVCPYRDATQSGVIMTAFGLNIPVIATNVGGLKEMVEDKINGLLIEPKNVNKLSEAITRLLAENELLSTLKANIEFANMNGANSWSKIAKDLVDHFRQILNNTY